MLHVRQHPRRQGPTLAEAFCKTKSPIEKHTPDLSQSHTGLRAVAAIRFGQAGKSLVSVSGAGDANPCTSKITRKCGRRRFGSCSLRLLRSTPGKWRGTGPEKNRAGVQWKLIFTVPAVLQSFPTSNVPCQCDARCIFSQNSVSPLLRDMDQQSDASTEFPARSPSSTDSALTKLALSAISAVNFMRTALYSSTSDRRVCRARWGPRALRNAARDYQKKFEFRQLCSSHVLLVHPALNLLGQPC